jgi:hypothetical protein
MVRNPTPRNPQLEALLEERDDLLIRINLLAERQDTDPVDLKMMRDQLFEIESRISAYRRVP